MSPTDARTHRKHRPNALADHRMDGKSIKIGLQQTRALKITCRGRCRCSRTGWRHTCSAAVTKLTFNYIPFPSHYLPPSQNSGPCNSVYCLGHSKNVYDDDDDDDDVALNAWWYVQSFYPVPRSVTDKRTHGRTDRHRAAGNTHYA